MTAFRLPERVERNAAARLAAHRPDQACSGPDCDQTGRHGCASLGGMWCDTCWPRIRAARGMHTPTPDPARTLDGLRAAAGIPLNATFTARTTFDDKAEAKGQRVSAARRAAARGDQ